MPCMRFLHVMILPKRLLVFNDLVLSYRVVLKLEHEELVPGRGRPVIAPALDQKSHPLADDDRGRPDGTDGGLAVQTTLEPRPALYVCVLCGAFFTISDGTF